MYRLIKTAAGTHSAEYIAERAVCCGQFTSTRILLIKLNKDTCTCDIYKPFLRIPGQHVRTMAEFTDISIDTIMAPQIMYLSMHLCIYKQNCCMPLATILCPPHLYISALQLPHLRIIIIYLYKWNLSWWWFNCTGIPARNPLYRWWFLPHPPWCICTDQIIGVRGSVGRGPDLMRQSDTAMRQR